MCPLGRAGSTPALGTSRFRKMQIFLVGFMGAGKTTLGKRLASKLNMSFIDMDQALEMQEGLSVEEIFSLRGEDHFRELEQKWINDLNDQSAVISLGGGTPCQKGIMDFLREKGFPIYVKVNSGIIVSRLMNAKTVRPLIEPYKNDKDALLQFVEKKLSDREPYYLKSKMIFESSDVKADRLDLMADLVLLSGRS